jgi:CelD/BcsL family acetyltransferase involved in cellulose biosynthesis
MTPVSGVRAVGGCEIIEDGSRFEELESAWQALWLRTGGGIFQSHHWIRAWWNSNPTACRLHIAVAWDDTGAMTAALPLVVLRWRGIRILQWAAQSVSDYCDGLGDSEALLRQLWTTVNRRGGFDIVRLKNIRPDASVRPILSAAIAPGEPSDACLQVACEWSDGHGWFRSLNKKKRSNHSRGERMLAEMGKISVRQIGADPPASLIARLSDLKDQWRRANGLESTCDAAMLTALVDALEKLGALSIVVLECDGEVVAGSINAVHGGRLLAFFATYDPVVARASPGIMLMTHYIRWAFDNGITEIDFLRGEEVYKFEFANSVVTLDVFLAGRSAVGAALLAAYRLGTAARRIVRPAKTVEAPAIGSAYFTEKGTRRDVATKPATAKRPAAEVPA